MRLDRLLAIVNKLLTHDQISARDLASEFEVTIRTIYRDMEAINAAGIPVVSAQGRGGGYGIMENYRLDRQVLTLQDMYSILAVARGVGAAVADKRLAAAAEKIHVLIPKEKRAEVDARTDKVIIDILPWGVQEQQKARLAVIQNALSANRLVKFVYSGSQGEPSERIVEPMTLLFKGYVWYLFAYCRKRRDYRLFRLTRMTRLQMLKAAFVRRNQTYHALMEKERRHVPVVSLILKLAPAMQYRIMDWFAESSTKIHEDGSATVSLDLPDDEWLYSFLLGFGPGMEVLSPERIRIGLCDRAGQIQTLNVPRPSRASAGKKRSASGRRRIPALPPSA